MSPRNSTGVKSRGVDPRWTLVACVLASSLSFVEGSVLSVALPAIRDSYGAGAQQVQWVMNAYLLPLSALLLLGGLNVALFHLTIDRRRAEWDALQPPPLQARVAGIVSLVLWFAIIAAGRIMAYNL